MLHLPLEIAHTRSWLLHNVFFRVPRIFPGVSPRFSPPRGKREMNYGNENKEKYAESSEKQLAMGKRTNKLIEIELLTNVDSKRCKEFENIWNSF